MGIVTRFKNGWNAFMNNDPLTVPGISYSYRPDRPRLTGGNEKCITVQTAAANLKRRRFIKNPMAFYIRRLRSAAAAQTAKAEIFGLKISPTAAAAAQNSTERRIIAARPAA